MDKRIRNYGRLASYGFLISVAFLFGLGLASGLEWTRPTHAAPAGRIVDPGPIRPPANAELPEAAKMSQAFVSIAHAVTPAVVRIQAERVSTDPHGRVFGERLRGLLGEGGSEEGPEEENYPELTGGSGFLVSPDGFIVTNNHVVEGFEEISVTLLDRRTYPARIIGRDKTTDVAVIKIDAPSLPYLALGDSEGTMVGEWVLAIGNPGFSDAESTLDFTVTSGIVSAKGRPLQIINTELLRKGDADASLAIEDFIQTDAVVNPGNSGGPLVNLRGEVIGINTAIASKTGFYQGYSFAIPMNLAQRVMKDLIEFGHVQRALLGISISDVTPEDAEVYGLDRIAGVRIDDFSGDDAPARRAGLQRHDVIVAIDGKPVERLGQLQRLVAQHRPGDRVAVKAVRYGREMDFTIQLTEAEIGDRIARARRPAPPAADGIGLELSDATGALARRCELNQAQGVVVTDVEEFSAADRKRVDTCDRVTAIGREPVTTARQAESKLRAAESGTIVSLTLLGRDGRSTRIANVRVP